MNPQQSKTAHSLYSLYETLPDEVQRAFLEELVQKKYQDIESLAFHRCDNQQKHNKVILGVMEGAFAIPDNFDDALPEAIENEFYPTAL